MSDTALLDALESVIREHCASSQIAEVILDADVFNGELTYEVMLSDGNDANAHNWTYHHGASLRDALATMMGERTGDR